MEDTGGQVVKVSPYNTTQRCSNCKELNKEKLTLKKLNCKNSLTGKLVPSSFQRYSQNCF